MACTGRALDNYWLSSQGLAVCQQAPFLNRKGGRGAGGSVNPILEINNMICCDQGVFGSESMTQTK